MTGKNSFSGPLADPAGDAGWVDGASQPRKGFFTDTSICIGCKACEVACKEWNALSMDGSLDLTGNSYDNTGDDQVLSSWSWINFATVSIKSGYIPLSVIALLAAVAVVSCIPGGAAPAAPAKPTEKAPVVETKLPA